MNLFSARARMWLDVPHVHNLKSALMIYVIKGVVRFSKTRHHYAGFV